jgi:hypothetical protein
MTPTSSPTLEPTESPGGGLSDKNKAIVGGVVGGIGGAALIGFIAFMAISRWKRNRRESDMEVFRPRSDYTASISPEMTDFDYLSQQSGEQRLNQRY